MHRATAWFLLTLLLCTTARAESPKVLRSVACADVQQREPADIRDRFAVGETVWAWFRIANDGPQVQLTLLWKRDGKVRDRVNLDIGRSAAWRTWARRKLRKTDEGAWTIDLLDPAGRTLGRVAFAVGDAPTPVAIQARTSARKPAPRTGAASSPRQRAAPPRQAAPRRQATAPTRVTPSKPSRAAREKTAKSEPVRPGARLRSSPRPRKAKCRAIVNLRTNDLADPDAADEHLAVDLRVHPSRSEGAATPGLLVRSEKTTYALRVVRHEVKEETRHGAVRRRWDMLVGQPLPDGPAVTWHGYPATLAPPDASAPGNRGEANLLRILSVIGPYVGLHASLQGRSAKKLFDHSRYATVQAPGRVVDPSGLLLGALSDRAARRARVLRPSGAGEAPDLKAHDFRRSALAMRNRELKLLTQVRCCTWDENHGLLRLDVPAHPALALAPHLPSRSGPYVAPDGCGRISVRDGRLVAGGPAGPLKLAVVHTPRIHAVLGVTWIPGDDHLDVAQAKGVWARLGR